MSYITQSDLIDELGEDRLVQLTDNARAGVIDESRVGRAIAYAVGTFDSYARTRYSIPVPVTEKVKSVCLDLAVFHLFRGRVSTDDGVYKVRRDAHNDAMRFLEALQKGTAALDVPTAEESATKPAASPDRVLKGSSRAAFGDDTLKGY